MKKILILALMGFVFILTSGALAEDSTLRQSFFVESLTADSGGTVRDFCVIEGGVYFTEVAAAGERYLKSFDPATANSSLLESKHTMSPHRRGRFLVYYDPGSNAVEWYDHELAKVTKSIPATTMMSFRVLGPESVIASIPSVGLTYRKPAYASEEYLTLLTANAVNPRQVILEIEEDARQLGTFEIFRLDRNMEIVQPLMKAHRHERITEGQDRRSPGEQERGTQEVRANAAGERIATFSPNLPGIHLFRANGESLGTVPSPGDGMIVPEGEPLPAGERISIQTDVLVGEDHLMVVDNVAGDCGW